MQMRVDRNQKGEEMGGGGRGGGLVCLVGDVQGGGEVGRWKWGCGEG